MENGDELKETKTRMKGLTMMERGRDSEKAGTNRV